MNVPEVPWRFSERYLATDFVQAKNVAILEKANSLYSTDNDTFVKEVAEYIRDEFYYPLDNAGNPAASGQLLRHQKGFMSYHFKNCVYYAWSLPNEILGATHCGICIDSTPSYTPTILKSPDNQVSIITLEDAWNSFKSTVIFTPRGEEIKKLPEGWSVFSSINSHWSSVNRIIRHNYHGEIIRINAMGGVVDVTPNHSIISAGNKKAVSAAEIKEGDLVRTPLYFSRYPKITDKKHRNGFFIGTEELAWLYGFFTAEGSAWNGKKNHVTFSNKDVGTLNKVKRIYEENFHHKMCINTGLDCSRATSNANGTHSFFQRFYSGERKKQIPTEILNAPKNIKRAFLGGYFAGDGSFDKRRHFDLQTATTNSMVLAAGLQWLMRTSLGRLATTYIRDDKPDIIQIYFNNGTGKGAEKRTKPRGLVKKTKRLQYNGYVYDLETISHRFTAGAGAIEIHNTANLGCSIFRAKELKNAWVVLGDVLAVDGDRLLGRHAWTTVPNKGNIYVLETTIHDEGVNNLIAASEVYNKDSLWAQKNGIYYSVQAKYNESEFVGEGPLGVNMVWLMGLPAKRVLLFGAESVWRQLEQKPKAMIKEWRQEVLLINKLLNEAYRGA